MSEEPTVAVATQAARLAVSLISPRVGTPALSDKAKYPTFLRTLNSQAEQMKVGQSIHFVREF